MRPEELAQDETREWFVWQHALRALEELQAPRPDVVVSLPPPAPLRSVEDVEACIEELIEHPDADAVITVTPSYRSPYFNMVVLRDGWARVFAEPESPIYRRQDVPPTFDMTTVAYAARTDFVLNSGHLFEGRLRAVVVPRERAVDIDEEQDLAFAEFLLNGRKAAHEEPV